MAAPDIDIQFDRRDIARVQRLLRDVPNALPKVMSRAINKAAAGARTRVTRRVAKLVTLRQKDVRDQLKLRRATYRKWTAVLTIGGKRFALARFGARQTRRGVTYRISRAAGRKRIARGFLATMPGGHEGAYERRDRPRLPVGEKRGPSVMGVFEGPARLAAEILSAAGVDLERFVDAQVGLVLERSRR